jgi:Kef-type K+ transport system membrane component KefB
VVRRWLGVASVLLLPAVAGAQSHSNGHTDPVSAVVLGLAVILVAAKLAGHLAVRIGQPAVLGELIAGVALGSADLTGLQWFQGLETDASIDMLSRIGVLILLFEVGLESTVRDMVRSVARRWRSRFWASPHRSRSAGE